MAIPNLIKVVRSGAKARVFIDGEELAAPIPRDTDVVAYVNPDDLPTVTLTLMARRVEVVNDVAEGEGDDGKATGTG